MRRKKVGYLWDGITIKRDEKGEIVWIHRSIGPFDRKLQQLIKEGKWIENRRTDE